MRKKEDRRKEKKERERMKTKKWRGESFL